MMPVTDATERRCKLVLHYDGAGFSGWQVQPGERTVQAEVESALARLTARVVRVVAAGRTDTGVHAAGQVVSACVPAKWTAVALERALNAVLPDDIWVAAVEEVSMDFHARYDALARGYMYRVGTQPAARSPFYRRWCWPMGQSLDAALLHEAAQRFTGTHSFERFARTGQPERGTRCTVLRSSWVEWAGLGFAYRVMANRFLHHMVRYMVGTMVDVARRRRSMAEIDALLRGEAGIETSPPAPAAGLCLVKVYYDEAELSQPDDGETVRGFAWIHEPA